MLALMHDNQALAIVVGGFSVESTYDIELQLEVLGCLMDMPVSVSLVDFP